MKILLILLLFFGAAGILMVAGVLLYCARGFSEVIERTRRTDVESFGQDDSSEVTKTSLEPQVQS